MYTGMKEKIKRLCEMYGLGILEKEPVLVTGGLLHKMYRVCTSMGEYAVKILNPDIMQRPEALNNMINSERIANALADKIPLVAAKQLQGQYVIKDEEFYYMVFDWLDGKSIFIPDITNENCKQIGIILGKIHAMDVKVDGLKTEENTREFFAWDSLLQETKKQNTKWCSIFADNISSIKQWDKQTVEALQSASEYQVISHRDLDPKNVMWRGNQPYIIDWEAAGYVNPFQEMIEVLNYWTVDKAGEYDKEKFKALMKAYTDSMDISAVDWDVTLRCSFDGMLGWLEYNVKRALGLEGSSTVDKEEGEKQLFGTISELKKYEERMVRLKSWLENIA